MNQLQIKLTEWFLRLALCIGMLSAVADRFGFWPKESSAWGNWPAFVAYTQQLNPFVPANLIEIVAGAATFFEIFLAIMLLISFRTEIFAKATGFLLLIFGIMMSIQLGVKAPLDYSVFAAAGAAFGLAQIVRFQKNQENYY